MGFIGSLYNPRSDLQTIDEPTSEAASVITSTTFESSTTTTSSKYVGEKELYEWLESQKGCIKKNSRMLVAHASDVPVTTEPSSVPSTDQVDWGDIINSRYSPITDFTDFGFIGDVIAKVADVGLNHLEGAASELGEALSQQDANKINSDQTRYGLPALPTYNAIKYLVDTANQNGSATLGSQYQFIAKRSFDYPFYNWSEVDTLIVYVDSNQDAFNNDAIYYENVAIPANSFCLFRSIKTSGGVRSTSYVFSSDQFDLARLAYGSFDFTINPRSEYSALTAVTPDGTQQYSLYSPYGYNRGDFQVPVGNNNYNTVQDSILTDLWSDWGGSNPFESYMGSEYRILTPLECLTGLYFNPGYSSPFMGQSTFRTWYVTAGFVNSGYSVSGYTTDSNNVNPKGAPVYVVDNNSPLYQGSTLDQTTVNNYADYGVSYNSDTNNFELDVNLLAGAIAGQIIPEFQAIAEGVFSAQPELGLGFDTPLTLDLPSLSTDLINSLVPSSGGSSGGWVPPEYPPVNTSTYFPATVPDYSSYMAVTVGTDVIDSVNDYVSTGYDLLDTMGVAAFLIPLVILALLWWAVVGGD